MRPPGNCMGVAWASPEKGFGKEGIQDLQSTIYDVRLAMAPWTLWKAGKEMYKSCFTFPLIHLSPDSITSLLHHFITPRTFFHRDPGWFLVAILGSVAFRCYKRTYGSTRYPTNGTKGSSRRAQLITQQAMPQTTGGNCEVRQREVIQNLAE